MHLEVECFENALTELLSTLSNTKYTKCPQITLLDFLLYLGGLRVKSEKGSLSVLFYIGTLEVVFSDLIIGT